MIKKEKGKYQQNEERTYVQIYYGSREENNWTFSGSCSL